MRRQWRYANNPEDDCFHLSEIELIDQNGRL